MQEMTNYLELLYKHPRNVSKIFKKEREREREKERERKRERERE